LEEEKKISNLERKILYNTTNFSPDSGGGAWGKRLQYAPPYGMMTQQKILPKTGGGRFP
jgi:hypothetical protein